jgi:hypothetical protein
VTDSKTYDGGTSSSGVPVVFSGLASGDSISGFTQAFLFKNVLGTNGSTLAVNAGSGTVNDGNGGNNYTLAYQTVSGTITPATLTITAVTDSKTYDGGTSSSGVPVVFSGLASGDSISGFTQAFLSKNVLGTNGSTLAVNAGSGTVNDSNGGNNYTLAYQTVSGTITPATLSYLADLKTWISGSAEPALIGTVTGFVLSETQATATTGALQFTSPADTSSAPGAYPINGSGLSATNYIFVQAPSNATALLVDPTPQTPPNSPPPNNTPTNQVTITFQNPNTGPIQVSFTPNGTPTANNQNNDVSPASLPPGDGFTHNNGFDFQPISQYDANQYSQFKLPGYQDQAGEAAIFTIIARAISPDHAADYLIDAFWSGTAPDWNGANGGNTLAGRVTFSDGAGHDVAPTGNNAFPIVAGTTDFGQLLKTGPVMISDGQTPAHWLLATALAPDGKGILCDDPISGKVVELAYDPATETVGGVTGIFDAKTKGFVSLADASGDIPAGALGGLAALQGFTPSTYFAVTVH